MITAFIAEHWLILLFYFGAVSLIALVTTVYDKIAAKKLPRSRVPEKTLLLLSAVGGSVVMLLTMLTIRHKTKHKKFMIGIPVIIALQAALIVALLILLQ